jgi:hypothetical protein
MPTHEAIVNTVIPQQVEKPIPVRTISTRIPKTTQTGQPAISGNSSGAESPSTAESVKLSPQLSALARKEQAHRQKEQALLAREKELEEKLKKAERFATLEEKLQKKDYSELEALGIKYEDYAAYEIEKSGATTPEAEKLKQLETEIEALKKGTQDSATKEYEATVAEYKKEIVSLVASNPEFSSVKERKCEEHVLQLILDSWEEDGTELTVEQAAKDVEDFLLEEAQSWTSLSKLKKTAEPEAAAKPLPKPGLKTLTQQVTVSSEKQPQKSLQFLSESERYAEARRRVLARRAAEQGQGK